MRINAETLYLTDNGACYCGDHLGYTAKHTGRDISGQPILPVTPDVVSEADSVGASLACESCGRTASRLYTA